MSKQHQSFCENLTARLFEIIDTQASLLTWQKGWDDKQGSAQLPIGHSNRYHGANIFNLLSAQILRGFTSNQWYTFNQIKEMGASVQKGAESSPVYFWKSLEESKGTELNNQAQQDDDAQEMQAINSRFVFKLYHVFNVEQTTLDPVTYPTIEFKQEAIQSLLAKHKVQISHYGNAAHYNSVDDVITLPRPENFMSDYNYNATLLHELVHWTGSKPERKGRACFKDYSNKIEARAEEELIAEIGSLLLATHFGLKGQIEGHASYLDYWKKYLKPQAVMRAASHAAKAFEFLIAE